jgi:hypothetical protein
MPVFNRCLASADHDIDRSWHRPITASSDHRIDRSSHRAIIASSDHRIERSSHRPITASTDHRIERSSHPPIIASTDHRIDRSPHRAISRHRRLSGSMPSMHRCDERSMPRSIGAISDRCQSSIDAGLRPIMASTDERLDAIDASIGIEVTGNRCHDPSMR